MRLFRFLQKHEPLLGFDPTHFVVTMLTTCNRIHKYLTLIFHTNLSVYCSTVFVFCNQISTIKSTSRWDFQVKLDSFLDLNYFSITWLLLVGCCSIYGSKNSLLFFLEYGLLHRVLRIRYEFLGDFRAKVVICVVKYGNLNRVLCR